MKNDKHHLLLEKWKSKLSVIISCQSEWSSSKNLQTINSGEGVKKREPSCTVRGNVNWYSHCGDQCGDFLRNKKLGIKLLYDPLNPTTGHMPWENHNSKRHMYFSVHCSSIYNSQGMEATINNYLSINRWMH